MTAHYDINGIAAKVQIGKRGPWLVCADDHSLHITEADGASLTRISAAPGTDDDQIVVVAQLNALNTQLQATLGAQSVEISALQAMVAKLMPVAPDVFEVGPALTAGTLIGNLKDGHRVASVAIEVQEAFDGDAGVEIGDAANSSFYMDSAHSDLAYAGTYSMTPPDAAPADSMITATLSGQPTKGKAVIRLSYVAQ